VGVLSSLSSEVEGDEGDANAVTKDNTVELAVIVRSSSSKLSICNLRLHYTRNADKKLLTVVMQSSNVDSELNVAGVTNIC
jgi:hypothetical protein